MSDSLSSVETLWIEDGNLILEADTARFKVYRGVLVKYSSVFCEILSIPQPSDQELFDGLPIVRLQDSSEDVTYFLNALYGMRYCSLLFIYLYAHAVMKYYPTWDEIRSYRSNTKT
jgi:hypothetical protein